MKRTGWIMRLLPGVLGLLALTTAADAAEKLILGYLRGSSGAPIEVMKAQKPHSIAEAVLLSESIIVLGPNGRVVEELSVDVPRPRAGHDDALFQAERRVRLVTSKWWVESDARPIA